LREEDAGPQDMNTKVDSQQESKEDNILYDMDLEQLEIDIATLIALHGEQHLNNLLENQLQQLQRDLVKSKENIGNTSQNHISLRGLGIRTTPLKTQKKSRFEENKKESKTSKQKLEETSSLLIESRQTIGLPEKNLSSQPKV
jgi:hypothetical protein